MTLLSGRFPVMTSRQKYAILVGDGMADYPIAELGGLTPLAYASTPNLDWLARTGTVGLVRTIPEGLLPGSDIGNLSLMGYDPHLFFTGRAPIEAAGLGITISGNQVAFRCNLVNLVHGRMVDYSGGRFTPEEAAALISSLKEGLDGPEVTLHLGSDYRHCLVMTGIEVKDMVSTPPHDITGEPWQPHLPTGKSASRIIDIMERARDLLSDHPVNRNREASGKSAANNIWLWGQGKALQLPTLQERFGLTGSVVSAVDLVKGLGILAGLEVITVAGATGYLGTNYAGKVEAAAAALRKGDFVYMHVEAPDETSHEGETSKKVQAIEEFDAHIVGPMIRLREEFPELRIMVSPDHVTALSTRTHASDPVPFVLSGRNVDVSNAASYCETAAAGSNILSGRLLFELLIGAETRV